MNIKTETVKTGLLLALLLLALYLCQSAVFPRLRLWGIAPLPLPLLAVGAGLFGGGLWGGVFGLCCGVVCDVSLGGDGLLFTVFLTAAGFFTGFLGEFLMARGFPSFAAISTGTLLLAAALQMFPFLVYRRITPVVLLLTGLKQTLYTLFFLLPVYACVRWAFRPWLRARGAGAYGALTHVRPAQTRAAKARARNAGRGKR